MPQTITPADVAAIGDSGDDTGHRVARTKDLPLPNFLIVDSPTKNITRDENPELVKALYEEIYRVAAETAGGMQFILIDSHLIPPGEGKLSFTNRRMANEEGVKPLFSDYSGALENRPKISTII